MRKHLPEPGIKSHRTHVQMTRGIIEAWFGLKFHDRDEVRDVVLQLHRFTDRELVDQLVADGYAPDGAGRQDLLDAVAHVRSQLLEKWETLVKTRTLSMETALDTLDAVESRIERGEFPMPQATSDDDLVLSLVPAWAAVKGALRDQAAMIERLQAALGTQRGRSSVGCALELRKESGGRRHFLAGRPVLCGTTLLLLTKIGWLPGRYEWDFYGAPEFHFSLPGSRDKISVPLPASSSLAWPR